MLDRLLGDSIHIAREDHVSVLTPWWAGSFFARKPAVSKGEWSRMGAFLLWTRLSVPVINSCSLITSPPMKNADPQSYQLLTTRYLRKQARQLSGQMVGLRESNDIEFVHRARVACRRLRAVMQMSRGCVPRKQFKVWRKEIRKLLKGLGDARDKDVQADFLWRFLADLGDPALFPGIARIVVGLETQREELQPTVVAARRSCGEQRRDQGPSDDLEGDP